jgi:hypothetical protein
MRAGDESLALRPLPFALRFEEEAELETEAD